MSRYSLTHVSNGVLLQSLHEKVALGRQGTAEVLALIAEIEKRRLYAEAGCSSMFLYCVEKLRFSEDEADRRIQAARAARRFPIIFELVADGRLHLTGVRLLRRHLAPATANSLLRASIHKTRKEIEQLIADRFPQPDVPTQVVAVPAAGVQPSSSGNGTQLVPASGDESISPAPERVKILENFEVSHRNTLAATIESPTPQHVPAHPAPPAARPRVAPLGAERYSLQLTVTRSTHDKLRRAQELLGRQVESGDVASVLDRALDALIAHLEKRKFAKTSKPAKVTCRSSNNPRHVPAHVQRQVWDRDKGQCTFIGDDGKRCEARKFLEFDHVAPVARGGESTVANVRLLCRTHNQLEAEREFGHALMEGRRAATAESREASRDSTSRAQATPS